MFTESELQKKYQSLFPYLDEKQRRLVAAGDTFLFGRGGISLVSRTSGLSRPTIYKGIEDLQAEHSGGGIRKVGGGRKKIFYNNEDILKKLKELVEANTIGDPMSPLLWTCKSTRQIAEELSKSGYEISHPTVASMLHDLGYSLQANDKSLNDGDHPDRDRQFRYINSVVKFYINKGRPVISVDTKKKELIGQYKNNGRQWKPKGNPEKVKLHDFPDKELGKAVPYGIYDISQNFGWVNVGCDSDTASFAVESIKRWWNCVGLKLYPKKRELLITADSGGSNGYRVRLWKIELQNLADEIGRNITVCHFPPGTSKWNKIEHRLFSHISMNWRGEPLVSHEVVVNLIGKTTTESGLKVEAMLDMNAYPTKIKISDDELAKVNIKKHKFHGEWNYTIMRKS
jgi:transposase